MRTLLNSRTYQLSSAPNGSNAGKIMNFSHARLRRLSVEQMFDAIVQITGVSEELKTAPAGLIDRGLYVATYLAASGRNKK